MVSTQRSLEKRNQNTSKRISASEDAGIANAMLAARNDRIPEVHNAVMKASHKASTPSRRWSADACQTASATTSIAGGYQVVNSMPMIQSLPRAVSTPLVETSEVDTSACSSPEMDSPLRPSSDNCSVVQQEEYMHDNNSNLSVQELKTNYKHRYNILRFLINCAVQNNFFRGDSVCHDIPVLKNYTIQRGNRLDQMTITFPNDKDGDEMTGAASDQPKLLTSTNCYEKPCSTANQPYCMTCGDRASCIDQNAAADMIKGKSLMAGELNLLQAVTSALHRYVLSNMQGIPRLHRYAMIYS